MNKLFVRRPTLLLGTVDPSQLLELLDWDPDEVLEASDEALEQRCLSL